MGQEEEKEQHLLFRIVVPSHANTSKSDPFLILSGLLNPVKLFSRLDGNVQELH